LSQQHGEKSFELNMLAIHGFLANEENVPATLVKNLFKHILLKKENELKKYGLKAKEKIGICNRFHEKKPLVPTELEI